MKHIHERTEMIIGSDGIDKLSKATVAVFGLGGVGGICTEALARSGVGKLLLVDGDSVAQSNCNRQVIATQETVGERKVDVMTRRLKQINPLTEIETVDVFYLPETKDSIDLRGVDFVVDAIDTLTAKLSLVETAHEMNIPVISSMGMGNKLDPTQIEITDIYKTQMCPLARAMRRELRNRRVRKLTVVYSRETPAKVVPIHSHGRHLCGSMMFAPAAAGLTCASHVVRSLLAE